MLAAVPVLGAASGLVLAETTDPSSFAQYGLAGLLAGCLVYLLLDTRRDLKALTAKALDEFVPALVDATNAVREATASQIAFMARPTVDAITVQELKRLMERVERRLEG